MRSVPPLRNAILRRNQASDAACKRVCCFAGKGTVTLSSGQVLRPRLLVGADGVNSKVTISTLTNLAARSCAVCQLDLPCAYNLNLEHCKVAAQVEL